MQSQEDAANDLTAVLAENDMAALHRALGIIARARGISAVAEQAGLTREALYKSLRDDSQPRLDTISRVCQALSTRLMAQPMRLTPTAPSLERR